MNQISIVILVVGAAIVGTLLYTNGAFEKGSQRYPFESELQNRVYDPDSLKIRAIIEDTKFTPLLDDYMFCGEFLAKNRLGGYIGWQRFIAMRDQDNGDWSITLAEEVSNIFPLWCS